MIALFLERLALLSSLSAIVLAVLWPHIRPKIFPLLDKFVRVSPSVFSGLPKNDEQQQQKRVNLPNERAFEHPKFSGHRLKRVTSEKESYRSTFGSLGGFSQSRLDGQPSFAHGGAQQYGGGPFGRGQMGATQGGQRNQFQSSMSLTIFSACVIALILYTLMKTLTVKLGRASSSSTTNIRWPNGAQSYSQKLQRASMETRDLRRDKRRLLKLSKEERTRELILHHGGKNISKAVRFLADELAKQKRLLLESLSENLSCNCRCHSSADVNQGKPMREEIAKVRTKLEPRSESTTSKSFELTEEANLEIEDKITQKVGDQASEAAQIAKIPSQTSHFATANASTIVGEIRDGYLIAE